MSKLSDLRAKVIKARRFYRTVTWGRKRFSKTARILAKKKWDDTALKFVLAHKPNGIHSQYEEAYHLSRKGSEAHKLAYSKLPKLV